MVRHHVLIGLGFKKQNFRNRALQYMRDRSIGRGAATSEFRLAVMPPSHSRPTVRGPLPVARAPLKFNF